MAAKIIDHNTAYVNINIDDKSLATSSHLYNFQYNLICCWSRLRYYSVDGGYGPDSPVFYYTIDSFINDSDFLDEIKKTFKIERKNLLIWPNLRDYSDKIEETIAKFFEIKELYQTFINRVENEKKGKSFIQSFMKRKNENEKSLRKNLYNIETLIIMWTCRLDTMNRWIEKESQVRKSSDALQKLLNDLVSLWNHCRQNESFNKKSLSNLNEKIQQLKPKFKAVAQDWNRYEQVVPHDTKAKESLFTFKLKTDISDHILNLFKHFGAAIVQIQDSEFDGEEVSFESDEMTALRKTMVFSGRKFDIDVTASEKEEIPKPADHNNIHITSNEGTVIEPETDKKTKPSPNDDTVEESDDDEIFITPHPKKTLKFTDGSNDAGTDADKKDDEVYTKFDRTLDNLTEKINEFKIELQEDDLKKTKLNYILDSLKKSSETVESAIITETSAKRSEIQAAKAKLTEARKHMRTCTDKIDQLNTEETLRKQLPNATWPVWSGNRMDYVDFRDAIRAHLDVITSKKLQLSTLRGQIRGPKAEEIKKHFSMVQDHNEAFLELDKIYGKGGDQCTRKYNELLKLKEPRGENDVELETKNLLELVTYIRMCIQYKKGEMVNEMFVNTTACKLREKNGMQYLGYAEFGTIDEILEFLSEVKETNESWVGRWTQPKREDPPPPVGRGGGRGGGRGYGRGGSSQWQNNTRFRRTRPCYICVDQPNKAKTHSTAKCPELQKRKGQGAKTDLLHRKGVCFICFRPNTESHNCLQTYKCQTHDLNLIICGCKPDQGTTRDEVIPGNVQDLHNNSVMMNTVNGPPANLVTEVIELEGKSGRRTQVLVLYDHGASATSMDAETADRIYGFKPLNKRMTMHNFVGGQSEKYTNSRTIKIVKSSDDVEEVQVFTMMGIKQSYSQRKFQVSDYLIKEFGLCKEPTSHGGTCVLIIGIDNPHLLPHDLETEGGVMVMQSRITGKLLLAGRTKENDGVFMSNKCTFYPQMEEVWKNISSDGISESRILKCQKCILLSSKCLECKKQNKPVPVQDQDYSDAIKKNLYYDDQNQRFEASYVYNNELSNLPVNREDSLKVMEIFEKRVERMGLIDQLNNSYNKMKKQGVLVLDSEEPLNPNLQESFIVLCYSLANNPEKTTQFRVCVNSSYKARPENLSLNDVMLPVPTYLNNQEKVLTNWRIHKHVCYNDISSAYFQVKSCQADKALRKLWVRPTKFGSKNNEPWTIAHCACCSFGDKQAGAFCAQAILECGNKFMKQENAKNLQDNCVMDDILLVCNGEITDLISIKEDVEQGLLRGHLELKEWTFSGDDKPPMKYLSYIYFPLCDCFGPRLNINWSRIRRGARSDSPLQNMEGFDEYCKKHPLTKRAVASLIQGVLHDPLQMYGPYLNNLKYVFRKIVLRGLDWKDKVDDDLVLELKEAIGLLFDLPKIKFPRRAMFHEASAIEIYIFFDGSLSGVGTSTVIKNIFETQPPIIRLLKNKSRVTAKDCNSAPRAEMLSCLIASRLFDLLKYELSDFLSEFKGKVTWKMIGDSTIVLSQLQKSSYVYKMWIQTKVHEIQELTRNQGDMTPEWYHCSSGSNIADLMTKPYKVKGYLPWQDDLQDVELKTIDQILEKSVPEINPKNIKINSCTFEEPPTLAQIAYYRHYMNQVVTKPVEDSVVHSIVAGSSRYFKAVNTLARILFWEQKTVEKTQDFHDSQTKAENLIFKLYQDEHADFIKKFSGDIYFKTYKDGVCVLRTRKTPNGYIYLKLVPPKSMLFHRLTTSYHRKYEASPQYIQAQLIRDGYYIPGVVKRLKKIQRNCPRCRRRALKVDPPEMGMLHNKRLIPSKCFESMQMDLAGPIQVVDYVNKRKSSRKAWILCGICDYSRMISLTMVESLSKDHLLCALQAHFFRYGKSRRVECDLGTNFKSAASHMNQDQESNDSMSEKDINNLQKELQSQGCTLVQRCAYSQWITGSAEHTVKLMKKALKEYKSPMNAFTWTQVLEKTQYLLNRRPIGVSTAGEVLTPADINPNFNGLDEKIDVDPNAGNLPRYYQQMLQYQQDFARRWEELYYSQVLQQKKWTEKTKSLELNDYVLILDHKNQYNYPTLGKVVNIQKDSGGINRYFSVSYRTKTGTLKTLIRTQNGLSLILKDSEVQKGEQFDLPEELDTSNKLNDNDDKISQVNVANDKNDQVTQVKPKVQHVHDAPQIIDV